MHHALEKNGDSACSVQLIGRNIPLPFRHRSGKRGDLECRINVRDSVGVRGVLDFQLDLNSCGHQRFKVASSNFGSIKHMHATTAEQLAL